MLAKVTLNNVSVRFRAQQGNPSALKEAAMRWLKPPEWYKTLPPSQACTWGLKQLNLDLKEGDRLGIMGSNGAGKSTLLKVVSGIYKPTEGSLNVQGRIAPLIEIGAGFASELTGLENIFLNGAILGMSRKEIRSRIESIVEFAELKDFVHVPVKYYSTGMYLRLGFSIATEWPPDILILDELFAGGDAAFIEKAKGRLREFVKASKILLLVTHEMNYVSEYCNKALWLDNGQARMLGEPEAVMNQYLSHPVKNTGKNIEPTPQELHQ